MKNAWVLRSVFVAALVIIASNVSSLALQNGLVRTPPMGWNTWYVFHGSIDETKIKAIADAMVSGGMRDAGYTCLNLDDNWMDTTRDANGELQPSKTRFPSGMPALVAYVRSKGLKLGIYGDRGPMTCMDVPHSGGFGNYERDALTYAKWGVRYLKYDNCNADSNLQSEYEQMSRALVATDSSIVFSICSWKFSGDWMRSAGNLWRTTGDLVDTFDIPGSPGRWSFLDIVDNNSKYYMYAGPGQWNDPDMLQAGNAGMSDAECRSQFSLWCIMAAPLIASNDIRTMSTAAKTILLNTEAIAVDQDSAGIQGQRVVQKDTLEVWVKPLGSYTGGAKAVSLFNRRSSSATISVNWSDIGLTATDSATVRDLWLHADLGKKLGSYSTTVASHGTAMLKITGRSKSAAPQASGYVSDIGFVTVANGLGPAEINKSNGGSAANDGKTLTLNGTKFTKGIGVKAFSNLRVKTGGVCSRFSAVVGVDDSSGGNGSVIFEVWADWHRIFVSDTMRQATPNKTVDLDISGSQELTLIVTSAGDNTNFDNADWADARLTVGGSPVVFGNRVAATPVTNCDFWFDERGLWYQMPHQQQVSIRLYSLDGRLVQTLVDGINPAGVHKTAAVLNDRELCAHGIVLCAMHAGDFRKTVSLVRRHD